MKRNVIVVSTNTQSRYDFHDVEVETLADVKRLLDEKGVCYDNQAFYEGVSKAEYKSDDSVMPSNMPFKGGITNDLVFQLSNASKKIASGAVNHRRRYCYEFIKKNKLSGEIKERYGLLYTSVSTDELERYISTVTNGKPKDESGCSKKFDDVWFVKSVIRSLEVMGYKVICPDDKAVRLSEQDIDDIVNILHR